MNNPIMYADPSGNYMILPFWNMKYISKIFEDIKNFNLFNKDSNVVFDANYFSFYKGSLVIKHQTNLSSFGVFGIIFLHVNHTEEDDLNHEWGHNIQEKILGSPLYMIRIAIPSMIGCALRYNDEEYFSFPWERSADFFGNVNRSHGYSSSIESSLVYLLTGIRLETWQEVIEYLLNNIFTNHNDNEIY